MPVPWHRRTNTYTVTPLEAWVRTHHNSLNPLNSLHHTLVPLWKSQIPRHTCAWKPVQTWAIFTLISSAAVAILSSIAPQTLSHHSRIHTFDIKYYRPVAWMSWSSWETGVYPYEEHYLLLSSPNRIQLGFQHLNVFLLFQKKRTQQESNAPPPMTIMDSTASELDPSFPKTSLLKRPSKG